MSLLTLGFTRKTAPKAAETKKEEDVNQQIPETDEKEGKKEKKPAKESQAHLFLLDKYKSAKTPKAFAAEFIKQVLEDSKSSNTHIDTDTWARILRTSEFPKLPCLFSGNKPYKDGSKYTATSFNSNSHGGRVNVASHRWAALVYYDPAKEAKDSRTAEEVDINVAGWHAAHFFCNEEGCVNPMHLIPTTNQVNQEHNMCKNFKTNAHYRCPHRPTCGGCTGLEGQISPFKWSHGF